MIDLLMLTIGALCGLALFERWLGFARPTWLLVLTAAAALTAALTLSYRGSVMFATTIAALDGRRAILAIRRIWWEVDSEEILP